MQAQHLDIAVANQAVSGLLLVPDRSTTCFILAHGAGAGMTHPFMTAIATGLFERGITTLRYQFRYMQIGSKRPDPPNVAQATVRAAVLEASRRFPHLPLIAGGKSFGGRMTSQAQATSPLPGVAGLAFLGFPLHPAGNPSVARADHLLRISVPMQFLQGTRDALADIDLMHQVVGRIGPHATLTKIADADHSFHVPARSGRTDQQAMAELLDALAGWIDQVVTR